jgi:hypothetical protein
LVKDIFKHFLVNLFRKIAYEDVCTDFLGALVLACFVDFDWFVKELDHVQDFDCVVRVLFRFELNEAIALMLIGYLVSRDMHIRYGTRLQK